MEFNTRMLVVMCVMTFLNAVAFVPSTLFSAVIMEAIVQHVYPHLDASQVKARVTVITSVLTAITAVLSFLLVPTIGALSDAYGRKKLLVAAASVNVINNVLFMLSYRFNILWFLYASKVLSFVEAAYIAIMHAYLADVTAKTERKNKPVLFGILMCSLSLGMLLGNLILGNFFSDKIWITLYMAIGMRVVSWTLLVTLIRDHPTTVKTIMKLSKNPFRAIRVIIKTKEMLLIFLMGVQFLSSLGLSVETSAGFIYAQDRFNWGTQEYGNLTASMLAVSIFCQLPLLWAVSRIVKEKYIVMFAYFYGGIVQCLLCFADKSWMYVTLRTVEGPSLTAYPAMQAIYAIVVPMDQLGTIYSAMGAISALASFVGSLIFGDYFAYCVLHFPSVEALTFPSITYIGNIYLMGGCIGIANAILVTIIFKKYFKTRNIKPRMTLAVESRPLVDPMNPSPTNSADSDNNSINADYDDPTCTV